MEKAQPIFLVSQPRSGSTMLQAVLSGHPEVATAAEPWVQLLRMPFVEPGKVQSRADWQLVVDGSRAAGAGVNADLMEQADEQLVEVLSAYYQRAAQGCRYFLDKTPRYYYLVERLFLDYPEARFIVLERHPASVVKSIYKTWKVHPTSNEIFYFSDDLLVAPARIKAFLASHGNDERVRRVTYEDLAGDPESVLKPLFEWLGLGYDSSLLDYGGNSQYRGRLGDPNAEKRKRLEARALPQGPEFLGVDADPGLRRFCEGLVHHHEREGFAVPRKDLWLPGKPTFEFDYFLQTSGVPGAAGTGLARKIRCFFERRRRRFASRRKARQPILAGASTTV